MLYFLAELLESFVLVGNRCFEATLTDRSSTPQNSSTLRHMAEYIGREIWADFFQMTAFFQLAAQTTK